MITPTPPPRRYRRVTYLHHTRDRDADVLLFFTDPASADITAIHQSSPIIEFRRLPGGVIDPRARGNLCRFLIVTTNTEYEVVIPKEKADHLAIELGVEVG